MVSMGVADRSRLAMRNTVVYSIIEGRAFYVIIDWVKLVNFASRLISLMYCMLSPVELP